MKILIAIPACRQLSYGLWESTESPHFDPKHAYLNQGYGTNIHISGPNERIEAIRETWAKDVLPLLDLRFFYGGTPGEIPRWDEVWLDCEDDYAHLPHKVIAITKWALWQGYDWMLKADDDTYIWPKRLLAELESQKFDYGGYMGGAKTYASGGPGYWLSKRAMQIVSELIPHTWAEDVIVGEAMKQHHIQGAYLTGHWCGFENHWIDISRVNDSAVTAHAVKIEDMRRLYAREHP